MRRSVLHIDSEKTWRGGENQLRLLLEHAPRDAWDWHLAAPPDSAVARRLGSLVQLVPLEMRGAALLPAALRLARYVRRHRIELIDCQSSRAHNLGLLVKFLVPDIRLVVHRRVDFPPGHAWWHRRKYLTRRIDRFVCISEAIAAVLARYGIPSERLVVVRSAVDPRPFQALDRPRLQQRWRREWGLNSELPIIGNVAFLTPQKDHETLLRALAVLRQQGHAFFCYIAGDGALRGQLEVLAAQLGLGPEHLRFLGVRTDVPELLGAADIFALSSQDEGLGTSLLDATHAGCALVGTAVGGIPELIRHEHTGLLVPPQNPAQLALALARLLADSSLRQQLNQAARDHADRFFSLRAMVEGNLHLYRQLLTS